MQPSKQPILPQIIDTYFLERFSYFSCQKYPQELQLLHLKPIYHLDRIFARNLQEMSKMALIKDWKQGQDNPFTPLIAEII